MPCKKVIAGRACLLAILGLTLVVSGCAAVQTPLPSLEKPAISSIDAEKKKSEIADLERKRQTHEQDAAKEIERR